MSRARFAALAPLLAPLLLLASGCHAPFPIEANVEFQTERGVVRGVSTEAGILALAEIVPTTGELSFRCRVGNGYFDDVAALERKGDVLALMIPKTSRPMLARFAAYPASFDDELFLEVRTTDPSPDTPDLLRCRLFDDGRRGDLLKLEEGQLRAEEIARRYAGAGVYAWRDRSMELVGILNGVWCEELRALAFIGLDEMATLLPAESSYFARRGSVKRADFEYGVPRSFQGERSSASDSIDSPTRTR